MSDVDDVRAAHSRLTAAFSLETVPPVRARRDRLRQLARALRTRRADLVDAVSRDFAPRAEIETLTAELVYLQEGIRHTVRHLSGWARARTSRVVRPLPGRTDIWFEPKGAVAILSPWNYPLQLALMPLVAAVAAGNRVLLKPSERSPASAAALDRLIGEVFPPDEVAVVTGGADVAEAVADLPWGHLLFTGSTATGRRVAAAAAATLTPVTLELGGRNPAIALPGADPAIHAPMIAWGAWLNAGQTCVAPNHLWVPEGTQDRWAEALLDRAECFGPRDYTAMIDDGAGRRLRDMLAEAEAGGAQVRHARTGVPFPPAVLTDVPSDCALLREEIFGPVLPILTYADPEEVLRAEAGNAPLAAYVFDRDAGQARAFLGRIRSGGGAVNATILHLAAHDLPFGGIGTSGQGAYHGVRGFREFSHERAVFSAARGPWTRLLLPPYPRMMRKLLRRMAS